MAVPYTIDELQSFLHAANIEIYAADHGDPDQPTLRIAERVRVHLMDSGVSLHCDAQAQPLLAFTVRSELSSAPSLSAAEHLERVRDAVTGPARAGGYEELDHRTHAIPDPGVPEKTLDTWYEMRFAKRVEPNQLVAEVRFCLGQPRCIKPT